LARRLLRQESGFNNFHKRNGAIGSERRSRAAHRSEGTPQTARSGGEHLRAYGLVETIWTTTTTTDHQDDRRDDADPDGDTTTFLRRLLRIPELPLGAPEDDRRDDADPDDDTTTFLRRLLRIPELPLGAPEDDHDATMTTTTFLPSVR
jgi:hypothetical protein